VTPEAKDLVLAQARRAIAKGAPRDKAADRMRKLGLDPSALQGPVAERAATLARRYLAKPSPAKPISIIEGSGAVAVVGTSVMLDAIEKFVI
jgi:hypothetical protein